MNYYRDDLTVEEFRGGLISAAMGLSTIVPVAATLYLPRSVPGRPVFLAAGFATLGVVVAYVAVHLLALRRSGSVRLNPTTSFVLVLALEIGLAFFNVGGNSPIGLYRGLLLLNAVFVGIIGDVVMQVTFWLAAAVLVSWSSWATGLSGGSLATVIVVSAVVMASSQAMVGKAIRGNAQFGRSTSMLDGMTDVAIASDTFEEGLEKAMAFLPRSFPCDHATILVRPVRRSTEGTGWNVVSAWPAVAPGDADLPTLRGFVEAVETGTAVVDHDHCFAPIGFTGAGELVVVMHRIHERWRGDPFSPEMLGTLAAGLLRVASQVDQVDLLRATSRTDPLTGLANRRVLADRAEAEEARSRRYGSPLSVAIIDVDHFKSYNDEYGHLAGDQLLASLSLIMRDRLRGQDLLVRYGGEEFCALLPDVDADGAVTVLDDLRQLAKLTPAHRPVSVSSGVAEWDGSEPFDALLDRADRALYEAKRAGRDRVVAAGAGVVETR